MIEQTPKSTSSSWCESNDDSDPAWCQLDDRLWIRGLIRPGTALAFVAIRGALDVRCADVVERVFSRLTTDGVSSLYLDVAEIELLDEVGLRALAVAASEFEARLGRLRLRCPAAWLASALVRTGLGRLLLPAASA